MLKVGDNFLEVIIGLLNFFPLIMVCSRLYFVAYIVFIYNSGLFA